MSINIDNLLFMDGTMISQHDTSFCTNLQFLFSIFCFRWAVGPFCRPDDDDTEAQNEWSASWLHTDNSTDGYYIFESSRLLRTASSLSDVQLVAGEEYDFGFAWWDPYENEDIGWTKAGHYVTGCGKEWITLRLAEEPAPAPTKSPSGAASLVVQTSLFMMAFVGFFA